MDRGTVHLIANLVIGFIVALLVGAVVWSRLNSSIWIKILLTFVDLYLFAAITQYVAPFLTLKLVNKLCDYFNIQYKSNWEEWVQKQRKKKE
ncbi:MAG: hypothetical protein D6712_20225 [Chloroflexi bacterium]|nr:MAG: hypothetical protein D6712_20225 [Chloroflexota bacterium]